MLQKLVLRISLLALVATALLAAPALAAPAVSGEFPLKTEIDTNNKIVTGPEGNAWVTLNGPAEDVARITPSGGVTEFDLAVAGASGIAVGPDANLWATRPEGVTRFSPANPADRQQIPITAITGNSPIVTGPDGRLWVATKDKLLAISLAAPTEPQVFNLPGLTPNDIDVAGSLIVVADANALDKRVFAVTTTGAPAGERKLIDSPQGVAGGGPGGQWAFTQPVKEPKEIGLLSPTAAPIIVPIPGRDAFGITLGSDGAYWSPDLNSDGLARVTTTGQLGGIIGFAKNSFPRQVAAGANNSLWVTLAAPANPKVGLVTGLEPPVTTTPPPPPVKTVPQTRLKGGPKGVLKTAKKFKPVQFGFNSPDTATNFECRIRKLAKKAGKKATASKAKAKVPKFKGCASPKGYKLRPGRYSFEVRAVNDGLVDPTPAKRSFRVVAVKVTASLQR